MWRSKWVEGRVEGGVELEQLKGRGWDLGGWVRCMLNISKNQKNQKIKVVRSNVYNSISCFVQMPQSI